MLFVFYGLAVIGINTHIQLHIYIKISISREKTIVEIRMNQIFMMFLRLAIFL